MSGQTPHRPNLHGPDFVPILDGEGRGNVTRFAPSPTGYLHLGHAYSALFAYETAQLTGGRFLLRLEDIDTQRCLPEFAQACIDDLRWLGLRWSGGVVRQSARFEHYKAALDHLRKQGLLYSCFCSRKQIRMEIEEAGRAPHGPGELIYPGICRNLDPIEAQYRIDRGEAYAWRLDVAKAMEMAGELFWYDVRGGWIKAAPERLGDVVLARKDVPSSYHLAVTIDDAAQGVTLVTRGEDLFEATHIHCLLQAVLGLAQPRYYHHNLISDRNGQRLAKRNGAQTIRHFRDNRRSPDDVWRQIGMAPPTLASAPAGLPGRNCALR